MDPSWPMRICPQTSELAHVANTRSKDGFKINFHTLNISGNQESHRGKPSLLSIFLFFFLSDPGVPGVLSNLTDVTMADGGTNSIQLMMPMGQSIGFQGNVAMQVVDKFATKYVINATGPIF